MGKPIAFIILGSLLFGVAWYVLLRIVPESLAWVLWPREPRLAMLWPTLLPAYAAASLARRHPRLHPWRFAAAALAVPLCIAGAIIGFISLCSFSSICK